MFDFEAAKQSIAELIDVNAHSEAAVESAELLIEVLEARGLDTKVANAYLMTLEEICYRHELAGYIQHHELAARDGIVKMINEQLKEYEV